MITSKNEPQSVGGGFLSPDVFYGLSTDTKPTDKVANGSTFKEIDTGKEYLFDYSGGEWHEAPSSGGGGGGGDNGLFIVNVTWDDDDALIADKTLAEVNDATGAGKVVIIALAEEHNVSYIWPEVQYDAELGTVNNVSWDIQYITGLTRDPPVPRLVAEVYMWHLDESDEEVIDYYDYSYAFPTEP